MLQIVGDKNNGAVQDRAIFILRVGKRGQIQVPKRVGSAPYGPNWGGGKRKEN